MIQDSTKNNSNAFYSAVAVMGIAIIACIASGERISSNPSKTKAKNNLEGVLSSIQIVPPISNGAPIRVIGEYMHNGYLRHSETNFYSGDSNYQPLVNTLNSLSSTNN